MIPLCRAVRPNLICAAAIAMSAALCSSSAAAQRASTQDANTAPPTSTSARDKYRAGVEAYADGRYKDAIDLFREADRMAPSAALSFNIARAYDKLRDASGALRWYRDYLRRAGAPDDKAQVQALIATLEKRLAQKNVQQVTILSEPVGATVVIDEQPVGVSPWTGELAPGSHRLELRLRGYEDAASSFELAPDHSLDVPVTLSREQPTKPASPEAMSEHAPTTVSEPPPSRPERAASSLPTWGYVSLGAAGLAFAGAVGFELMRRSAESDARSAKTQLDFADDVDRMQARRTTARVLAGAGAGFAVLGGTLLLIDFSKGGERRQPSAALGVRIDGERCLATWQGQLW